MVSIKKCRYCGNDFKVKFEGQLFCCENHEIKATEKGFYVDKEIMLEPIQCENCGVYFTPHNITSKCCSKDCLEDSKKRNMRGGD